MFNYHMGCLKVFFYLLPLDFFSYSSISAMGGSPTCISLLVTLLPGSVCLSLHLPVSPEPNSGCRSFSPSIVSSLLTFLISGSRHSMNSEHDKILWNFLCLAAHAFNNPSVSYLGDRMFGWKNGWP